MYSILQYSTSSSSSGLTTAAAKTASLTKFHLLSTPTNPTSFQLWSCLCYMPVRSYSNIKHLQNFVGCFIYALLAWPGNMTVHCPVPAKCKLYDCTDVNRPHLGCNDSTYLGKNHMSGSMIFFGFHYIRSNSHTCKEIHIHIRIAQKAEASDRRIGSYAFCSTTFPRL